MRNKRTTVFISYNQKSGDTIADKIQNRLAPVAQVVRDKTSIPDWGSIKAFMKSIRNQDMAVMIITEEYLRSSGCMFEVVEAMKDEGWDKHAMFVVADEATDIYTPKNWPRYLEYWKQEEAGLICAIESVGDAAKSIKLGEELHKVKCIEASLIDFLGCIADSKNPSVDEAVEKIYQRVCVNLPEAENEAETAKADGICEISEVGNIREAAKPSGAEEVVHIAVTDYHEDRIIYVEKSKEEPGINTVDSEDWGINKCVHMPVLFLVDASSSMAPYMKSICDGIRKFANRFVNNETKDHHEEHMLEVPSVEIGVAVYNNDVKVIHPFAEASIFRASADIPAVGGTNLYTGFCGASEYLVEYIKSIVSRGEKVLAATMLVLGEGASMESAMVLYSDKNCFVFQDYEFQSEENESSLKLSDIYHYIPVVLKNGCDGGMQTAAQLYKLFPKWYRTEEKEVHRVKMDNVGRVFAWVQGLLQSTSQYKGMREGSFPFETVLKLHTPWIETLTSEKVFDYLFQEYEQSILKFTGREIQNTVIDDISEKVLCAILYFEHEGKQSTESEISAYLKEDTGVVCKGLQELLRDRRIRKIGIKENISYKAIRPSERENKTGGYLSGSAGTGDKILKNSVHWTCTFDRQELVGDGILYRFHWAFDKQYGHMSVIVRNKDGRMSNGSTIDTENGSAHKFDRPLGLYNDGSMRTVFEDALQSIGVVNDGVYAEGIR